MDDLYKEISLQEYLLIQEKIARLDYSRTSIDEIFQLLKPLRNGLSMTAIQTGIDLCLFRGVKWDKKPETLDKISYPPKSHAKINRASQEGEQLFYSSTSKNIILYEMNSKRGDRVVISEWRPTIHLIFPLIGYTNENLKKMGSSRSVNFGDMKFAAEKFRNKTELQIEIIRYLSELFCQPINSDNEEKYRLTIAIAKLFYTGEYVDSEKNDGRFSGLTYPSIKGNGEHDNYAVNIKLFDAGLIEPNCVEFIEIQDYDLKELRYKYTILDYANSFSQNNIEWKDLKNTWTIWDNEEIFFDENEPIRAFTSEGEEYHPD